MRNVHTFWLGNLRGRDYLEDLDVDGRVILKWILGEKGWKTWVGLILFGFEGLR
jgi:hypothetical protein